MRVKPLTMRRRCGSGRLCAMALLFAFVLSACSSATRSSRFSQIDDWKEFEGTWTAVGNRNTMLLDGNHSAAISNFEGSIVLTGASRPEVGFRAHAIAFSDTVAGLVGRAVWTDEKGDQIFSELRGEGTAAHNKIIGTILGGTGRYAGAVGSYEFSWQFVIENEDGNVQGQSAGLNGRVRVGAQRSSSVGIHP